MVKIKYIVRQDLPGAKEKGSNERLLIFNMFI